MHLNLNKIVKKVFCKKNVNYFFSKVMNEGNSQNLCLKLNHEIAGITKDIEKKSKFNGAKSGCNFFFRFNF